MSRPDSPFRILAKSYANDLISRDQYVEIRSQLLKKLQIKGKVGPSDLRNFTAITQGTEIPKTERTYTTSDWLIVGLGLIASAVLAYVLYA